MSKKILDRSTLLAALATKVVPKAVKGLGTIFFKELSALERLNLFNGNSSDDPKENFKFMAGVLPTVIMDADNNPLLTEADIDHLMNGKGTLVQSLINTMLDVNGITKTAEEEVEGNSETAQSSDSPTT